MSQRPKMWKLLFEIFSYSSRDIRKNLTFLIFHYYPTLMLDDLARFNRIQKWNYVPWKHVLCENKICSGNSESASRISLNGKTAIEVTIGNSSVPIYICETCFQDSENNWNPSFSLHKSMDKIGIECENHNCSQEEYAEYTVFPTLKYNSIQYRIPKVVRYCKTCFTMLKNEPISYQTGPEGNAWTVQTAERNLIVQFTQRFILYAINPVNPTMSYMATSLLVKQCPASLEAENKDLAGLVGAVLSFLKSTRMLPNDETGGSIEQIKERYLHPWLRQVIKNHYTLFLAALMPSPCEEFRASAEYDQFYSLAERIASNLQMLLLLATYGLLTLDMWTKLIPLYFDVIQKLKPKEEERKSIEEVLCKLLESDLTALPFDLKNTWLFATKSSLDNGLNRIQTVSNYKVIIPFEIISQMFTRITTTTTSDIDSNQDIQRLNYRIQQLDLTQPQPNTRETIFRSTPHLSGSSTGEEAEPYWKLKTILTILVNQIKDLNVDHSVLG